MDDERTLEAYRFYLRARVEALGLEHPLDPVYNEAITDVLALLTGGEEVPDGPA